MGVIASRDGGELRLVVDGVLDTGTWDDPVELLTAELAADRAGVVERVVVDLRGVTFLDSSGLGTLVRMRTTCHDAAVPLSLAAPRPMVRKLLVMTGLDSVFDVAPVSVGDRQDPSGPVVRNT